MKRHKPRLTAKAVDALETMAAYAYADAEAMVGDDATDDDNERGEAIMRGCEWVGSLTRWYRATHPERSK